MIEAGNQALSFSPVSTNRVYTVLFDNDLVTMPVFQPQPNAIKLPGTNIVMTVSDTHAVPTRIYSISVEVE